MNIFHKAAIVLTGAALAAGSLVLPSAEAQAAGCTFRVTNLRALDLQEGNGDEIFVRLGNTNSGERQFTSVNQVQTMGNPTEQIATGGDLDVRVKEKDPLVNDQIGGPLVVVCQAVANQTHLFEDFRAKYMLTYSITLN